MNPCKLFLVWLDVKVKVKSSLCTLGEQRERERTGVSGSLGSGSCDKNRNELLEDQWVFGTHKRTPWGS